MTEPTKKTRRGVSRARLLKELIATMDHYTLNAGTEIGELLDAIRNDIVQEAMDK